MIGSAVTTKTISIVGVASSAHGYNPVSVNLKHYTAPHSLLWLLLHTAKKHQTFYAE